MKYKTKKDILEFIYRFVNKRGYSPSRREIAIFTGKSTGGISYCLKELKEERLVSMLPFESRTVRLTERGESWIAKPKRVVTSEEL